MMRALLISFLLLSLTVQGQKKFAQSQTDTLCSPYFFGRGYVKNGVDKAAEYLKTQLQQYGVTPLFNQDYFQSFTHQANIFIGKHRFSIGETELQLGVDYIPDAQSGTFEGEIEAIELNLPETLDKEFFRELFGKYPEGSVALAVNQQDLNKSPDPNLYKALLSNSYPLIIYGHEKLTASVSQKAFRYPILKTSLKNIPEKTAIALRIKQIAKPFESKNVGGIIWGNPSDSQVVFITAHYDHLGGLDNETYIPGANDNASGVSAVLNLAKDYAQHPPKKNIAFLFFAGEEIGLLGSKFYTENPAISLAKTQFVLNVDLLGTGEDGFAVVNGKTFPAWMEKLDAANQKLSTPFTNIKLRGEAANSDHYWFTKKGVPAFFIYTMGGITAYHDIFDKAETLPFTRYEAVLEMIKHFISEI
ncbi:M28 family metallopeptidase [Luteibaculum oceani]|uniref:M28 family peptidase n=1 Tax=Luteibaculum oceani TaxID=1294296 RepID=A0A5C6V1A8_9FLAO|nr:M28 family peptidase [Luteibaculum oceani]TXC78999.1 M28 family peptidase [Luteibaculum oceani]